MITHRSIMQMSVPASMGLTCKDALMIFSQNETLQLQKRIQELEKRLEQYEPVNKPVIMYNARIDWFEANEEIQTIVRNWVSEHVYTCNIYDMYCNSKNKLSEVCQISTFIQAVSEAFELFTKDEKVAHNLAKAGVKFINSLMSSVHYAEDRSAETNEVIQAWCANETVLHEILFHATIDYIFDTLVHRKIIDYPRECDDSDWEGE